MDKYEDLLENTKDSKSLKLIQISKVIEHSLKTLKMLQKA